jgi:hypothetical protein
MTQRRELFDEDSLTTVRLRVYEAGRIARWMRSALVRLEANRNEGILVGVGS